MKEFIDKRHFEAVLLAWQMSPDPDLYDIFHSSKTKAGEFNFVGYASPEADKLIEAGRREFSVEKRSVIYRKLHEILSRDEPYTFLYVPDVLTVVHRRFRGVRASPIGIGYNFIHWFVPAEEQKYRFLGKKPDA